MVYIPPYVIDYDELGDTVKAGIEKNDGNVRYAYDALNELSAEIQLRPATGQEILNKLLPVDGIGSGLDAEYLGGRIYSEYASSAHTHPLATTTNDGFMSLLDKQKLNSVAQGAEMNVHSDWNETDFQSDSYIRNKPKVATIDGSPVDGDIAVFTGPLSMRGADKDEMATMLDYFKQTDFISASAGNEDANKPIVLDPTGLIHPSMIPAVPAEAIWGAITGTLSNQADLQAALDLKSDTGHNHDGEYEPVLGNPTTDGEVLSSLADGTRSWIPMSGGTGDVDWGEIGGTLSNQTDLQSALDAKSDTGHNHDGSYYLKTEFLATSTGSADAGKPIVLDSNGHIDPSMMDVSVFYYVGPFTPVAGTEYPDTTGESHGAFWVVQGVDDTNGYTFTGGDLSGLTVNNGDFMVWAAAGWSIMAGEMNPTLYYKLDGTQALTDPFAGGDQQLKNIADGTDGTDAVTKAQLDSGLATKSDVGHNHDSDYLAIDGKAIDSTLFDGKAVSAFELSLGNPANDGEILSSLADGTRSWIPAPSGAIWGSITGTLSDQTDLQAALDAKAATDHDHVMADITDLSFPVTSVNTKTGAVTLNASEVGALPVNGKATDSSLLNGSADYLGLGGGTLTGDLRVTKDTPSVVLNGEAGQRQRFEFEIASARKFSIGTDLSGGFVIEQTDNYDSRKGNIHILYTADNSVESVPTLQGNFTSWAIDGAQIYTDDYHPAINDLLTEIDQLKQRITALEEA